MNTIGRSIAKGAAWMVMFRAVERSIGIVSTLILARLLMPADFGLIAMAMSFVAILELLWTFTFDNALIQNTAADRSHYDTAWTLNICLGTLIAIGLLAVAYPASWFYDDPRLIPIILCLAGGAAIQGFENIGVVEFRKEMRFGMEFGYQVARKLISFAVVVPLAFALRSYWALVAGMLAGRLGAVALSYVAHPFRPRLRLTKVHELVNFSKWLFINNVLFAIQMRSQDFVIGKVGGAQALGLYNVAYEISTLPSTELISPINRAVFPGFAKVAADCGAIIHGYLRVLGMLGLVTLPAGLGIAASADLLIPTMLGSNWLAAIPIMKILAVYGALAALGSVFAPTYMALGRPRVLLLFTALNVALFVPTVIYGMTTHGVIGAAWGCLAVVTIMLPVTHFISCRALGLPVWRVAAEVWRPATAAAIMYLGVTAFVSTVEVGTASLPLVPYLLAAVALGIVLYALVLVAVWLLAGRPPGSEMIVLAEIRSRLQRRTP